LKNTQPIKGFALESIETDFKSSAQ